MRIRTLAIAAVTCLVLGGGLLFASLDKETRGLLATLPTDRDVLSWKQNQRDAAFRALDPRLPRAAGWDSPPYRFQRHCSSLARATVSRRLIWRFRTATRRA